MPLQLCAVVRHSLTLQACWLLLLLLLQVAVLALVLALVVLPLRGVTGGAGRRTAHQVCLPTTYSPSFKVALLCAHLFFATC
jgi:hypothetical protein